MAELPEYGLTLSDVKLLRWMAQQVRSGAFQGEQHGNRRSPWGVYRVKTNGSHAPDTTQAGILCDSTWTAISGETPSLTNDSGVTIPDATKCYAVPGGNESLLIITAHICTD